MKCVLIKSRHIHKDITELPAIFQAVTKEQIFDFDYHKKIIHATLGTGVTQLTLYITGLTPVLVSVINYCRLFNIDLLLYHYDTSSKSYVPQTVV